MGWGGYLGVGAGARPGRRRARPPAPAKPHARICQSQSFLPLPSRALSRGEKRRRAGGRAGRGARTSAGGGGQWPGRRRWAAPCAAARSRPSATTSPRSARAAARRPPHGSSRRTCARARASAVTAGPRRGRGGGGTGQGVRGADQDLGKRSTSTSCPTANASPSVAPEPVAGCAGESVIAVDAEGVAARRRSGERPRSLRGLRGLDGCGGIAEAPGETRPLSSTPRERDPLWACVERLRATPWPARPQS
eukprot:COSAG04_NODE_91_length_26852_cov_8.609315_10_plen_250_part_00